MSFNYVKDFIASFQPKPLCFVSAILGTQASVFFFHIRRFDGVLERDELGLELTVDDLLREADAGARGLLIESIAAGTDASYQRFEVADDSGRTVLTFDFALALRTIRCAWVDASERRTSVRRGRACDNRPMRRKRLHAKLPESASPVLCGHALGLGSRSVGNSQGVSRIRTDNDE